MQSCNDPLKVRFVKREKRFPTRRRNSHLFEYFNLSMLRCSLFLPYLLFTLPLANTNIGFQLQLLLFGLESEFKFKF